MAPFIPVYEEPEPEPEKPKPKPPVIEEVNEGPQLFARVSSMDNLGKVKVTFNQKLAFKSKGAGAIGENATSTTVSGRRLQDANEIDDTAIELTLQPGDYEGSDKVDLSKLDFIWELEGYTDEDASLNFQLNFSSAV